MPAKTNNGKAKFIFRTAHLLSTDLSADDLVLPEEIREQISLTDSWLRYRSQLLQHPEFGRRMPCGYRVLLCGPNGTGKTMAARLIGKSSGKKVLRIDLNEVVSKYIGETEKNLDTLLERAESKDWILFFDEADALFGKRTSIKDSHDRYANLETSSMLQELKRYSGLIIFNLDQPEQYIPLVTGFFDQVICFSKPDPELRKNIWLKILPQKFAPNEPEKTAEQLKHLDLTGKQILQVTRAALLKMLSRNATRLQQKDLEEAVDLVGSNN
jgi:SpoVK/Ycf46/Vps4 family AAA+-type ATPase